MACHIADFSIDQRFCGPPGVGNGGYVCGLMAKNIYQYSDQYNDQYNDGAGHVAQVRLHAPVPMASPLELFECSAGAWELRHKSSLLATASISESEEGSVPAPVEFSVASEATKSCRGLHYHPFPECFVCGPARMAGDGLRIFPGRLSDASEQEFVASFTNLVAAPWIPDKSLLTAPNLVEGSSRGDNGGHIPFEFMWAALDCAGSFSVDFSAEKILVLGQFRVHIKAPVAVGEPCVVMGWLNQVSGRKHFANTVIYNSQKQVCGIGEALWIQIQS